MDGERVAGEEHLDETELDQAREIDARPGVDHGGSSHDQDAPARLSYVAHLKRDAGDENLLRFLGRHLAAHEAEDLGLPGALERRDAHALMADHHLHPRFSVLEDDAPGATRLAVDRDRGVHLDVLNRYAAAGDEHLRRQAARRVKAFGTHSAMRDLVHPPGPLAPGRPAAGATP